MSKQVNLEALIVAHGAQQVARDALALQAERAATTVAGLGARGGGGNISTSKRHDPL